MNTAQYVNQMETSSTVRMNYIAKIDSISIENDKAYQGKVIYVYRYDGATMGKIAIVDQIAEVCYQPSLLFIVRVNKRINLEIRPIYLQRASIARKSSKF